MFGVSTGANTDVWSVFAQYGVLGVIAFLALLTVRYLFLRSEKQYADRDAERERELQRAIDRADRLEAEVANMNAATKDSLRTLTAANQAVAEAMAAMGRRGQ